jgi:hypothetical protein
MDRVWHVPEANLRVNPPDGDLTEGTLPCEVMTAIFSKEPLDLCCKPPEVLPGPQEEEGDMIEVINRKTGEGQKISTSDPTFYDAGGFKAGRYKDSRKPKDIPPFVWNQCLLRREEQPSGRNRSS